jgi:oxygen-independent coproporphyrinogen-3 oxidase
VSNFATSAEYRCQHNLSYWLYQDYYGVGPGAHSRVSQDGHKIALSQICDISKWLQWSEKPIFQETVLSRDDEFKEVMIMGLRSKVGVDLAAIDPDTEAKHGLKNKLAKLLENDYIDLCMGHVILTRSGLLKLNLIIRYLTDW